MYICSVNISLYIYFFFILLLNIRNQKVLIRMAQRFEYHFCSCCEIYKYFLSNPDKLGHCLGGLNAQAHSAENNFIIADGIKNSNITNPRENVHWKCLCITIKGVFPGNERAFRRREERKQILLFSLLSTQDAIDELTRYYLLHGDFCAEIQNSPGSLMPAMP